MAYRKEHRKNSEMALRNVAAGVKISENRKHRRKVSGENIEEKMKMAKKCNSASAKRRNGGGIEAKASKIGIRRNIASAKKAAK